MIDPWMPFIAVLSGKCIATPTTWPVRKVYRIEGYVANAAAAARRRECLLNRPYEDPQGARQVVTIATASHSSERKP